MTTNWPAYRLTLLLLVSCVVLASPVSPQTTSPPASAASSAASAAKIGQVEIGRSGQLTTVRVSASDLLACQAERLSYPDRVVLDCRGARLGLTRTSLASEWKPVRRLRLGQFRPDVARLVIDLDRPAPYTLRSEGKSVTLEFGLVPVAQPSKMVSKQEVRHERTAPRTSAVRSRVASAASLPEIKLSDMPLPESLTKPTAVLASQGGKVEPAAASSEPVVQPPAAPAVAKPQVRYSGEPISVNLKDVDLRDFFRLVHEISGLNIVVDPNVKGSLTIVLDEVPWDQALEIVLRNNNLDKQLEGNVLRVATRETLKKEAEMRRDLARAEAEAVDHVTTTRVLSYAKATGMRDTLKRFLSSRGEILADERSNALIIRDIPSVLPDIDNLIRQLDRKSQQVEIEARVVVASRAFARDIGTQFAFASTATGGRNVFGGAPQVGPSPFESTPPPPLVVSGSDALPLNTNLGAVQPTSGFSFLHRSPNFALDYIITAAEAKGVGKLLSKPKVITQNNEKAIVKQGTKIPVQTTINNTISVQFIDAVLKLEVTPQITAEGTVFMDVVVENTQIDAGIPRVQGVPALDTQQVESKILINDGGTVVIGGIMVSSQRTDVTQVPLIGSIPIIGHLFKRTNVSVTSQELLFFLTPRIVPS